MKKIQTSDLFSAMRVIKIANIKEELKPIVKKASEKNADVEDVGLEAIITIMESLCAKNAEVALYEFLGNLFEMQSSEVGKLDLNELVEKINELVQENDLKSFFSLLSNMIGKK